MGKEKGLHSGEWGRGWSFKASKIFLVSPMICLRLYAMKKHSESKTSSDDEYILIPVASGTTPAMTAKKKQTKIKN